MNEANFVEVGGADREKDDINYITTEINEDVSVKVGGADSEKDDNSKPITTEMNENVSEDCKTESLSKIVQDTKSTEYIIGTLNGFILDGDILNIKFKVLTYSFNNDKWEINRSTEEIEIKFLKNNESRRIKRFNRYLAMRYMIFKNNDILLVLNDYENLNQDLFGWWVFSERERFLSGISDSVYTLTDIS
ncbi:1341_t:CDS:2 [Rhizophagus irregularis]|nr:1341_t:CDS:2 [Rhizophagus irregularis]